MELNIINNTIGKNEMVGVGLFVEEEIKREPIDHQEVFNIPYFSGNNDPLNVKSEDVSNKEENGQYIHFSVNSDPLNIKSEDIRTVLENRTRVLNKVIQTTKTDMVGEIIDCSDSIKQENNRDGFVEESLPNTSGFSSSHDNVFDISGKSTCKLCGLTLRTPQGLRKHQIVHKDPSELRMYKCEQCAFVSKHKSYLKSHILNVHGTPSQLKKFSCETCNYKTNYKRCFKIHLFRHIPLVNNKEKEDYKCESCEYTTNNKHVMKRHSKVHKSKSELTMSKCHLCPYQSKLPYGVENHLLTHKSPSQTPMFKCELCSYETKWRHCLRNHIKVHEKNSEPVTIRKCEICEFTTNNIYSLETHMKLHTVLPEKPKKIYTCYTCGYQTKRKTRLVKHMPIHNPLWQLEFFECAVCGLRLKDKRSLRDHILLVHGPLADVDIKPNF